MLSVQCVRIYTSHSHINVATSEAVDVTVVAMDGRVINKTRIYDSASIAVAPGIYVVRVVNDSDITTKTVVVR